MDNVSNSLQFIKGTVNGYLRNKEPWQVVAITTTTVLSSVWLWNFVNQDESIRSRVKKKIFRLARYIPQVRKQIEAEIEKTTIEFENNMLLDSKDVPYIKRMPEDGLSHNDILAKVDQYLGLGHYNWKSGRVSGAVYFYDSKLIELTTKVYGKASYTNPLHPDVFPGICKMEAEIIRMSTILFNGGRKVCGSVSLLVKSYFKLFIN